MYVMTECKRIINLDRFPGVAVDRNVAKMKFQLIVFEKIQRSGYSGLSIALFDNENEALLALAELSSTIAKNEVNLWDVNVYKENRHIELSAEGKE